MTKLLSQTELAEIALRIGDRSAVEALMGHIRALEGLPAGTLLGMLATAPNIYIGTDIEIAKIPDEGTWYIRWLNKYPFMVLTKESGRQHISDAQNWKHTNLSSAITAARAAAQLPPLELPAAIDAEGGWRCDKHGGKTSS